MLTLRHQQNPLSDFLGGGATLAYRSEEVVLARLLARVQALQHSRRREVQKCPDTQLLPRSKHALDELVTHAAEQRRKDERRSTLPGWQALAEEVAQELAVWRRAHPQATLAEMEEVVLEVGQRLQARALEQLVQASATADLAAQPVAERPACPQCGGRLEPRGRQRRTVRPARQRAALAVTRSYAVCTACGAGLFPPG